MMGKATVHFLNVGKGNCSIIEHENGHVTMIDIDNSHIYENDAHTEPLEYLEDEIEPDSIHRFILTHPDMDHMSGLFDLDDNFEIRNFWDTDNDKEIGDGDWDITPYSKDDWECYQDLRDCDENPKCNIMFRGYEKDGLTVLSPSKDLQKYANETGDYHHSSYVIMFEFGGKRILFGGDASKEAWDDILQNCGKSSLKADIFLAPHHGSKANVNEDVFKYIKPDYIIISVARGIEYDPYYKSLAREEVLTTKYYGTIVAKIEDDLFSDYELEIEVEKNADEE